MFPRPSPDNQKAIHTSNVFWIDNVPCFDICICSNLCVVHFQSCTGCANSTAISIVVYEHILCICAFWGLFVSTDCASALIFGLIVSTYCASVIFLGHLVSTDCEFKY